MALLVVGSGLISAALLALGFGFVVPVSAVVGDLCDLLAIGSGIFSSGCSPASSGTALQIEQRAFARWQ
jgi:hypothetical protein